VVWFGERQRTEAGYKYIGGKRSRAQELEGVFYFLLFSAETGEEMCRSGMSQVGSMTSFIQDEGR